MACLRPLAPKGAEIGSQKAPIILVAQNFDPKRGNYVLCPVVIKKEATQVQISIPVSVNPTKSEILTTSTPPSTNIPQNGSRVFL